MNIPITIVLGTFNGELFLEEQLNSYLSQTILPSEIIICDDNSTDSTITLLKSWKEQAVERHPTLRIGIFENTENIGVRANFQKAISYSTGSIIVLSDQDDTWLPNRIETAIQSLNSEPQVLLTHCNAALMDSNGGVLPKDLFSTLPFVPQRAFTSKGPLASFDQLVQRNTVTGATVAFKAELLQFSNTVPNDWLHDEWLAIVASLFGQVVTDYSIPVHYRQHSMNVVGVGKDSFPQRLMKNLSRKMSEERARDVRRAQDLLFLAEKYHLEIDAVNLETIRNNYLHKLMRAQLSNSRIARIRPIFHALFEKDYFKYGDGFFDALRDFVQPA